MLNQINSSSDNLFSIPCKVVSCQLYGRNNSFPVSKTGLCLIKLAKGQQQTSRMIIAAKFLLSSSPS